MIPYPEIAVEFGFDLALLVKVNGQGTNPIPPRLTYLRYAYTKALERVEIPAHHLTPRIHTGAPHFLLLLVVAFIVDDLFPTLT